VTSPRARVCFVCLGNICRSPTAEGVFRHLVQEAGLSDRIEIDSAGTAAYHVGEPPDRRSAGAAAERGVTLRGAARRFERGDFERFDYVVAMDGSNHRDLLGLATTDEDAAKLSMLRRFDPASPDDADVPDPYYGGPDGFANVFEICRAGCAGLLAHIRAERGL